MSRQVLGFGALLTTLLALQGCSGSVVEVEDPGADEAMGTEPAGTGGTSSNAAGTGGSAGSPGTPMGGGSQQGGNGSGKGGSSVDSGAAARTDAAGNASAEGGPLDRVATLPLPAPGTPGIDYLSDLKEEAGATNGWGPFEKDQTNGWTGMNDGCKPIDLFAGAKYTKGIGAHAYSKITYKLGGAYRLFVSDIGFAFCETPGGTVVFQVFVDGAKAYDSGMFNKDSKRATTVNVDVTGKDKMDIVVTDGADGLYGDHVAWAGARLVK